MRKRMYKCMMSALVAALFILPYTGSIPVSAQAAEQRVAAAGEAVRVEVTKTYTDDDGVIYSWYGYEDGTAGIYQIDFTSPGVELNIPGELEEYRVTRLNVEMEKKKIQSLTIPESIVMFESTFKSCDIEDLYYNPVDAIPSGNVLRSPFYASEIGEIHIGDKVEVFEPYLFYDTIFEQNEIVLEVSHIKSMAFDNASIETLTITNQVQKLETKAFMGTEIQQLHFNSPDVTVGVSSISEGPFDSAVIYNLDFCEEMTEIPDYLFACAHFKMKEFTFTQERIGTYAFWRAWNSTILDDGADKADRITLTADVKTLGERAFLGCHMEELVIESNLETEANGTSNSPFYNAFVYELTLGDDVTKLPDFLFSYAYFQMPELKLDTPHIGTACFHGAWVTYSGNTSPVALTFTEDVEYIGASAFAYNKISKLQYMTNAVSGATSSTEAPFQSSEVTELEIGGNVTEIQPLLFANVKFTQDIELTIDVPIGNYAFYSSGSSYNGFTNLTIGENVTSMGKGAFQRRNIGSHSFEAISAPNQLTNTNEGPFYNCVIGELAFGEKVELLDRALLCGAELKQEELVIPDSVQEIGNYFIYNMSFLNDGVVVDTLRIGDGLKKLTDHSFHQASFTNIFMEAVEFAEDFKLTLPSNASSYLPVSENLYIHRESDFYDYFSRNAQEENYYCEDYMVTTVGDEVLDKENKRFETTTYETCSVCGYQTESSEYVDAFSVTFMAMEKEVAVLYCKLNGSVEVPEAPEYSGNTFERWDKSFDNITTDIVVTAIYSEIPEPVYRVTVHAVYADGSESEYTSFDTKNGEVITLPVYEGSLPKNLLDGYEGERQFAPEFIWNVETEGGTYTVTGEKEIVATEGNFYEVKFVADDGSVISTQKVPSGYDAVPPVIEGNTVSGGDAAAARCWEKNYYNVTSDREVRLESVKEPGETPDPDDGKELGETPDPDDGKEPGESPDPDDGKEPGESPDSDDGKEPGESPDPDDGKEPDESPDPDDGKEPGESPDPDDGKEPGETPDPDDGKEPGKSPDPDDGKEPGESPDPDDGKEPGETPDPDDGKEPEKTPAPEEGRQPTPDTETSAEPEVTPAPEQKKDKPIQPSPAPHVPDRTTGDMDAGVDDDTTQDNTDNENLQQPEASSEVSDADTGLQHEEDGLSQEDLREPKVKPRILDVVVPVAATAVVGGGGLGGFWLLFFCRRRRVIGTVMDVDGEAMEGVRVVLNEKECITGHDGEFVFYGLGRGNHNLCIFGQSGKIVLTMDIFTDTREDEDAFTVILDETIRIDSHREGRKYFVDVVLTEDM